MNRSLITGIAVGVLVAGAGGALAAYQPWAQQARSAQVLDVKPLRETRSQPREECRDVPIVTSSGQDIATVAGAAAGGYAGNRVQKSVQDGRTRTDTRRECRTVDARRSSVVGYEVTYRIKDETARLTMDHRPADRIWVRDGQWVPGPDSSG